MEPFRSPSSISLVRVEARRDGVDANSRLGRLHRVDARQAFDAGLGGAVGAATGHGDNARRRSDADDGAALAPRAHAPDGLGAAQMHAGEMGVDHQVPVFDRHVLGERDALHAGIVDQHVDLPGVPVDAAERVRDAAGISDIDRQVGDAIARLVGRVEIEGEYLGALVEKAKGDRIADAAACTGDRSDLA